MSMNPPTQEVAMLYGIAGIIFFVGIIFILISFIYSAVFALIRRNWEWSISAVLSGLPLICGIGFICMTVILSPKMNYYSQKQTEMRHQSQTSTNAVTPSAPAAVIFGNKMPYFFHFPNAYLWKEESHPENFDKLISYRDVYIGTVISRLAYIDEKALYKSIRDGVLESSPDAQISDYSKVEIAGKEWITFDTKLTASGVRFHYVCYAYTGQEGTWQITGWSGENLFPEAATTIWQVAQSFNFPLEKMDLSTLSNTISTNNIR